MQARLALLVALAAGAYLAAQSGSYGQFAFERPVTTRGPGPQRLAVDHPLLAGGPFRVIKRGQHFVAEEGLADLRLFDSEGRPVPYLLVHSAAEDPLWIVGRVLAIQPTKRTSGFEVDFGRAESIDGIGVEGIPAPFLKRLSVEGSGDRARWTALAPEATPFDLPAEKRSRGSSAINRRDRRARGQLGSSEGTRRDRARRCGACAQPRSRRAFRRRAGARRSNRQIPYLVERRDEPLQIGLTLAPAVSQAAELKRAPGRQLSVYRLSLPYMDLPPATLVLETSARVFQRSVQLGLERAPDRNHRDAWFQVIASETWRHADQQAPARALSLRIDRVEDTNLSLVVEEGDNAPLPVTAVRLLLP